MIVLDEHLADPEIRKAIERWYPGKVINIKEARRLTHIDDEDIPSVLHHLKDPTFVTINWTDFWKKLRPHSAFCLICLKLPLNKVLETPLALRHVLRQFPTKKERLGKILLVGRDAVEIDD